MADLDQHDFIVVCSAPLHGWLVFLLDGWALPNPLEIAHAGCGPDSAYSVRLWRPEP